MSKIEFLIKKTKKILPKKIFSKLPQEIGVVLLSAEESAKLNSIYRNKRKATDVLSFYYNPNYGEILICPKIVKEEAAQQRNPQDFHMTWMIVHGILHLAGVHHEDSLDQERRFLRIERDILGKLKVLRQSRNKIKS